MAISRSGERRGRRRGLDREGETSRRDDTARGLGTRRPERSRGGTPRGRASGADDEGSCTSSAARERRRDDARRDIDALRDARRLERRRIVGGGRAYATTLHGLRPRGGNQPQGE